MRLNLATRLFTAFLSLMFVGMSASAAHAYLDAGTGSMILQVLLGGLAGLLVAGKLYWHKLLTLVGVRRSAPEADEEKKSLAGSQNQGKR